MVFGMFIFWADPLMESSNIKQKLVIVINIFIIAVLRFKNLNDFKKGSTLVLLMLTLKQ